MEEQVAQKPDVSSGCFREHILNFYSRRCQQILGMKISLLTPSRLRIFRSKLLYLHYL